MRRFWRRRTLRAKGMFVVGLPVVVMLLTSSTFVLVTRETGSSSTWVTHTRYVQVQLQRVLVLEDNASIGERDYLLTKNPSYLASTNLATASLPALRI